MKRIVAILLLFMVSGCATIHPVASSRETFAACQAADAVTTYVALQKPGLVEGNPIMAKLISHGWLPFLMFKAALVWYVYWLEASPSTQMVFNAIACAPVVHNTNVLIHH